MYSIITQIMSKNTFVILKMIDTDMNKAHSYRYDIVQDVSYKSK